MPAAYDTYDYPSYWENRDYEHKSEVLAIKRFLGKISSLKSIIDIGGGYGRLIPVYSHRAKRITLTDPSAKSLSFAKKQSKKDKNITFIQSSVENLTDKTKSKYDLVLCIRVLHHIKDIDQAFKIFYKILSAKGYLIIEFANKSHMKATIKEFSHGNLTYPLDITPKDIRSKRNVKKNTLPFINYHPDVIFKKLEESGFEIKEIRSVSNFRSSFLKRVLPQDMLLSLEGILQKPLASLYFGPSIFVLARKKDS